MVERFEEVVFSLKPDEVSPIFETEFGLHVVKVYDKKPPTPASLDEVREVIVEELGKDGKNRAVEAFLDARKAEAIIEEMEEPEGHEEE